MSPNFPRSHSLQETRGGSTHQDRWLAIDPANVEDVQKMDGDDPADSARYGLKSRLASARAPYESANAG